MVILLGEFLLAEIIRWDKFSSLLKKFVPFQGASRGEEGDTSPALKKKSVFEKPMCPENV